MQSKGIAALAIVIIIVAVASFYVGRETAPKPTGAVPITFVLNWAISGEQTGIVAALSEGFYADEGLAVTILRGYGSSSTANRLLAGEGQFGFIDTIAGVRSRAAGIPLKYVAMGYHKSPVGLFGKPGVGPTTPDEIRGKRIGVTAASTDYLQLQILAHLHGINLENEVTLVFLSSAAKIPAVLSDEVDAVSGYDTGEGAQLAHALGVPYEELAVMKYADFGIDTYGNGVAALENYIESNPEIVSKFVRATMKGWAWALQNPDKAVDDVVKMFPELDRESVELEWQITSGLIWNAETQEYGIGYMIPEKMQRSIDITVEAFGVTPMSVENIMTNEFVSTLPDDIKFPLPV